MALILSLDSSVSGCSVALHRDGILLGTEGDFSERSAARSLAVLCSELLLRLDVQPASLDAVAVAEGPGSYTGLRIASSTAKGLCFALDIPLIAVNSLLALAEQVRNKGLEEGWTSRYHFYAPMFDARRMEVYTMVLDEKFRVVMPVRALVLDDQVFTPYLGQGDVLFFGNGATKVAGVSTSPRVNILDGIEPSAADMGRLAWEAFTEKRFESVDLFEPRYLKEFMIGRKPVSN